MRADRLLSLVMLLQTRGRMTARELAEELEVSERTIYRDIEALSFAGIPVYTERGPGGGCALLDSYRTSLTGLTTNEVRALFMLSIPALLDELGVSQELKAALLKLSAALPADRRLEEEKARQRIHLDSSLWSQPDEPVPHLQTIQEAVWQDRKLRLKYRLSFDAQGERTVDSYGLVAKASVWYLVCARDDHVWVVRVSDVLEASILDRTFERPADFDLAAYWKAWCEDYEARRPLYPVTVRVSPDLMPILPGYFAKRFDEVIAQAGPPDNEGWITLTLPFETLESARLRLLGYGRVIEVLEPEALRKSVIDYATQIIDLYSL